MSKVVVSAGVQMNMVIRLGFATSILASVGMLSGCSLFGYVPGSGLLVGDDGMFRDRQGDYLSAETLPRTYVPPELDSYIIDDLLIIPDLPGTNQIAFLEVPRPVITVGNTERGVVIQTISQASWIIANVAPGQVWPRVREYWSNSGIGMEVEDPVEGVMETGWFVLADNVISREKFRITIEPGFQDDTSEIRLLHYSMAQATPILGTVKWPEVSSDSELEAEMMGELSVFLADVEDLYSANTVSLLAGNISSKGKASIISSDEGAEMLRLDAEYTRSWAAVGRALERAGVVVEVQNSNVGIFEVSYIIDADENKEPGLFKKIISINGLIGEFGDAREAHSLRIQLIEADNGVDILVDDVAEESNRLESSEEAKASLLATILEYIA